MGVTIKGELIEGGTVVADKLVVQGEDGLYYKLNTDGVSITAEQTEYNSLNGSVITAKSVTAEKISVSDLVAFGADIGGFHITTDAIYSGVKESVDNTTRGVYLDSGGQLCVGDGTSFLRYRMEEDGSYKLELVIASNGLTIDSDNFKLTADGTVTAAAGEIGGFQLKTERVNGRTAITCSAAMSRMESSTVCAFSPAAARMNGTARSGLPTAAAASRWRRSAMIRARGSGSSIFTAHR